MIWREVPRKLALTHDVFNGYRELFHGDSAWRTDDMQCAKVRFMPLSSFVVNKSWYWRLPARPSSAFGGRGGLAFDRQAIHMEARTTRADAGQTSLLGWYPLQ